MVDIGAGSGMDTFLSAKAVGPSGAVIAIDMTPAMLERGRENVVLTGLTQIDYREGLAEALRFFRSYGGMARLAPHLEAR